MNQALTFDDIASGEIEISEARKFLGAHMRDLGPKSAHNIYAALKAWLWKAINSRRRDAELREWHDLMRRIAAGMADDFAIIAERILTLNEVLYESLTVSEILTPEEVMKRKHVRDSLRVLATRPYGTIDRATLGAMLELGQANLTRVLVLLQSAGLVEKTRDGKQALISLTPAGRKAIGRIPRRVRAPDRPYVIDTKPDIARLSKGGLIAGDTVKGAMFRSSRFAGGNVVESQYIKNAHPTYKVVIARDISSEPQHAGSEEFYWSVDEREVSEQDVVLRVHLHE